jgi:hypothetical protein
MATEPPRVNLAALCRSIALFPLVGILCPGLEINGNKRQINEMTNKRETQSKDF